MSTTTVSPAAGATPKGAGGGKKAAAKKGKIDIATVGGIVLAIGAIVGGLLLEKGSIFDIAQYTAAIIVFGGTAGAVMVSTPMNVLKGSMRRLGSVFQEKQTDPLLVIEELIDFATKAR